MNTREDAVAYCKTLQNVMEDYPFYDDNWTVMRHKENKKIFACIYERHENIWINVKCDTEWRDFWHSAFTAVIPAYHMNKEHWNSIILDGTIPEEDLKRMIIAIGLSYLLVKNGFAGSVGEGQILRIAGTFCLVYFLCGVMQASFLACRTFLSALFGGLVMITILMVGICFLPADIQGIVFMIAVLIAVLFDVVRLVLQCRALVR